MVRVPPIYQPHRFFCVSRFLLLIALLAVSAQAERINQEGRILGPEPVVTTPLLFNTAQADAVVSAMQIMPLDSAWNEDISTRPLLANSDAMIAQISSELLSSRRTLRAFYEMNYALVPDSQPLTSINFLDYPEQSDPSPWPIPSLMPVETWPRETGSLTNAQWQQDINDEGGDRHSIVVMPGAGMLWETWQARLVGSQWQASNGAKFDLRTNTLRPAGWTSGDAAGLPMFPALVRYDECQRGMVEHAMRIVVKHTRREYLYPATHHASVPSTTDPNIPAMGQRLRLKASFTIPANWTIYEKAVCLGLKKYGALVADNGNFFSISVTPDDRYPSNAFNNLSSIGIDNFEVVQSTGATEGPRSPGAPTASAGADLETVLPSSIALSGSATGSAISAQWTKYSGPGSVTFGNAAQTSTTASFSLPGTYTLMLHVRDGVHAVARDAVIVNVKVPATITRVSNGVTITFPSFSGQTYRVERTTDLANGPWTTLADSLVGTGSVITVTDTSALATSAAFYRVQTLP
ncbi:MAG: hypothetical protein QM760_14775 [Nibricoccus sp.]